MSGGTETEWVEIEVPVESDDAPEVAGYVATTVHGARAGVELRGASIVFWVPRREGESALREARAAVSTLAAGGVDVDPGRVQMNLATPESEWRDGWKKYFRVTRVSPRLVIVPSWEHYAATAGDVILEVDPGRAFGTGAHASTRLCLIEIDALSSPDPATVPGKRWTVARFLDVGTGSGILAVAAAKLWPESTGVVVDIDPVAVEVAMENAERNRVGARVGSASVDLGAIEEQFDLVMANIEADVLRLLRETIVQRVAPGGILILSGLLEEEVEDVARGYAALSGFEIVRIRRAESLSKDDLEWCAATLRRVAA